MTYNTTYNPMLDTWRPDQISECLETDKHLTEDEDIQMSKLLWSTMGRYWPDDTKPKSKPYTNHQQEWWHQLTPKQQDAINQAFNAI